MSEREGLRVFFGVFLFSLLFPLTVFAKGDKPEPLSLLRKSLNPSVPYSCKIVVTSWRSPKGETALLREWRLPDGRYRIEYLAPKSLRGVVILSDGKRRWRVMDGKAMWNLSVDELKPERLDLISRNYRLETLKSTMVLNRKAWLIAIIPKADGKPVHRFWIDEAYGIVLKGELIGEGGKPLAFMAVSDLRLLKPGEVRAEMFEPLKTSPRKVASLPMTKADVKRLWKLSLPEVLPFGFVLERIEAASLMNKRTVLHAIYTDGLLRLSLFVSPEGQVLPSQIPRLPTSFWKQWGRTWLLTGNAEKELLERLRRYLEREARKSP